MIKRKIFNLSLHRSATESFSEFMREHGFRFVHWPGPEFDLKCVGVISRFSTQRVFEHAYPIIEENDSFADVPYCFLVEELLHWYPDALFFIIVRDVPSWIRSARHHIGDRELHNLEKFQYWINSSVRKNFIWQYSDPELSAIYMTHLARVVNMMQIAHAHFRLFLLNEKSLDQMQLIVSLSEYIGFKATTSFPTVNVSEGRFSITCNGTS